MMPKMDFHCAGDVIHGTAQWSVLWGKSEERLLNLEYSTVHSSVQDPPGGGKYLKKDWDGDRGGRDKWIAWLERIETVMFRILRPGAYMAVWAFDRTLGWTQAALENAGFNIRQILVQHHNMGCTNGNWDVAKGIESQLTLGESSNKRWHELRGRRRGAKGAGKGYGNSEISILQGARKSHVDHKGAFDLDPTTQEAATWLGWGTRLRGDADLWILAQKPMSEKNITDNILKWGTGALNIDGCRTAGKWPSTVFSAPKASRKEKELGCEELPVLTSPRANGGGGLEDDPDWAPKARHNSHATIKSIGVCREYVRLITPPGGLCVDPFCGSGTTGSAVVLEGGGRRFIGIEKTYRHCLEAQARIKYWAGQAAGIPAGISSAPPRIEKQLTLFGGSKCR